MHHTPGRGSTECVSKLSEDELLKEHCDDEGEPRRRFTLAEYISMAEGTPAAEKDKIYAYVQNRVRTAPWSGARAYSHFG